MTSPKPFNPPINNLLSAHEGSGPRTSRAHFNNLRPKPVNELGLNLNHIGDPPAYFMLRGPVLKRFLYSNFQHSIDTISDNETLPYI